MIIFLFSYLYTGSKEFKSSLDKILNISDTYQLNELKRWSENELIQRVTISNNNQIPDYYLVSHQCKAERLKKKVCKFIKANFNKVCETDEWKKLAETQSHLVAEVYRDILSEK